MLEKLQEITKLIKDEKSIVMLAPTFPIDFEYPNIIGMLRELGFNFVTELTYGARMVNWSYVKYIEDNPDQKYFIASPCPMVVAMIESQYPELKSYLVPIVSPMSSMAKIYKKHHPDHKVIFVSPCLAKKNLEAPKYAEFIDLVLTFQDLKEIFDAQGLKADDFNRDYYFDSFIREYTKVYPISGGLASTAHISQFFQPEEILVTDGVANIKKALEDIKSGRSAYKFLDILNCPGGCIGGPCLNNQNLTEDDRKTKVKSYAEKSSERDMNGHQGKVDYAKDVDFSMEF